jgi:hypothetical protein
MTGAASALHGGHAGGGVLPALPGSYARLALFLAADQAGEGGAQWPPRDGGLCPLDNLQPLLIPLVGHSGTRRKF